MLRCLLSPSWMGRLCWAPGLALALAARLGSPLDPLLGRAGEAYVARTLRRRGVHILGQRVRTPHAEVDLVVESNQELMLVEVKTGRTRDLASLPTGLVPRADLGPGRRLSPEQIQRLHRAARWLGRRSRGRQPGVVLLAEVLANPEGLTHRCAFRPIPLQEGPGPREKWADTWV